MYGLGFCGGFSKLEVPFPLFWGNYNIAGYRDVEVIQGYAGCTLEITEKKLETTT